MLQLKKQNKSETFSQAAEAKITKVDGKKSKVFSSSFSKPRTRRKRNLVRWDNEKKTELYL